MNGDVCVFGLGWGDETKGATVDWLCATRRVDCVVRFNGGPQAGHNVVTPDGRHHTFSQFGSGTFWGVPTHLSRFCSIDPLRLASEADHLESLGIASPYRLLRIDPKCPIVTPYDAIAGKLREKSRGKAAHGTCGLGVGEAVRRVQHHSALLLEARDLSEPTRMLIQRLGDLRRYVEFEFGVKDAGPDPADLAEAYQAIKHLLDIKDTPPAGNLVYEGAQGILLDEWHGFHPHTTWSTCTPANALTLAEEWGREPPYRLGVTRTYHTRHGAGPFPTEGTASLNKAPEFHNGHTGAQGQFRVGALDLVLLRYAVETSRGVDGVALSHLDDTPVFVCERYEDPIPSLAPNTDRNLVRQAALTEQLFRAKPALPDYKDADYRDAFQVIEAIEAIAGPVVVTGHGPTWKDRFAYDRSVSPTSGT